MPVDVDALVLSNDRLSDDYNVVRLAAPVIARQSRPGQFVMVKPRHDSMPLLRRPFSVFEVLRDRTGDVEGFSLLNKAVGVVTRALFGLEVGQRLQCLGPLGRPFSETDPTGQGWMVAGGVGLAPFLTLAEALRRASTPVTLFYGARSARELYYVEAFERLGVRVVLTTEDGSRGERGLVTGPLERALRDATGRQSVRLYACGPTPMMRAVAELAARYDRQSEVSLEPVMGCGLGGCYSCVVRVQAPGAAPSFVRSCLEGPVFPADTIVWSEMG